jgi:hypothetical protein
LKRARVVFLDTDKARIKRKIRVHLRNLGFHKAPDGTLLPPSLDKEGYRSIHRDQRAEKLSLHRQWIEHKRVKLGSYFASGHEVDVANIRPRLELAPGGTWQGDLFRLAGLYWQIPISEGYGRRMRFLVWDDQNEKLIGILALGDAVFNLGARDKHIGWDHHRRADALVHLMDAYVLGALPPYNMLLGGKLIASLLRTKEVVKAFNKKYRASTGVISKTKKAPRLAAITTTSALGRSSIYNRVRLGERKLLEPIGYTGGWGHFHISDTVFEELRSYLKRQGDPYANGNKFGNGPNWRIRVIRRAFYLLGLKPDLIKHGFSREVFFCPIAKNALKFLRGENCRILYGELPSVASVAKLAIERWCIPRAKRVPEYKDWKSEWFFRAIEPQRAQARSEVPIAKPNAVGKRSAR